MVSATRVLDSPDRSWLVNGRLKFVGCLANLVSLSHLLTEMRRASDGWSFTGLSPFALVSGLANWLTEMRRVSGGWPFTGPSPGLP